MKVTVAVFDREPLEPVTVTWTIPVAVKVHAKLLVPDPATLLGVKVQLVLLLARLTVPANPCNAVTVIVELAAEPATTVTAVGLADIVKS